MLFITRSNRNFGLTQEQFEAMVEKLRQGDESLFETIFLRHFGACMDILKRKYKAPHEEAYDCVMWALLRTRQALLAEKADYGNLESYVLRIAANQFLKTRSRNREIPMDDLPESPPDAEPLFDGEMLQVLERSWLKMGEKCRILLQGFYYDKNELKQLTVLLGDSSEANTRKRKERCLNELRKLFFESL